MTWTVFSNPLADMYGPWFLGFYALYCIALMWLVARARRRCLQSHTPSGSPSISLPPKIDPYYIAWLKGGIDNVLKLAMMRLAYAGLLTAGRQKGKTFVRPYSSNPEKAEQREQKLNRLERLVLLGFESGAEQKKAGALTSLRSLYQEFDAQAQREGYTYPASCQITVRGLLWAGLVLMLGMGGYKLSIAWMKGHHNVGFLIAMMLFFGLIYYAIFLSNRARKADITPKGKKLLSQLSTTLPKDKKSLKQLDIAMVAVALDDDRDVYSNCAFGRQAYALFLIPFASAAAGSDSFSSSGSDSGSSSSDSSSSSGCSGCGGCGGD